MRILRSISLLSYQEPLCWDLYVSAAECMHCHMGFYCPLNQYYVLASDPDTFIEHGEGYTLLWGTPPWVGCQAHHLNPIHPAAPYSGWGPPGRIPGATHITSLTHAECFASRVSIISIITMGHTLVFMATSLPPGMARSYSC